MSCSTSVIQVPASAHGDHISSRLMRSFSPRFQSSLPCFQQQDRQCETIQGIVSESQTLVSVVCMSPLPVRPVATLFSTSSSRVRKKIFLNTFTILVNCDKPRLRFLKTRKRGGNSNNSWDNLGKRKRKLKFVGRVLYVTHMYIYLRGVDTRAY
jgi:hypothetical protein